MNTDHQQPELKIDDEVLANVQGKSDLSSDDAFFDDNKWDLSHRNLESSISVSQFSLATTNTADASSLNYFGMHNSMDQMSSKSSEASESPSKLSSNFYGTTIASEKHTNYVLMYDMLTGIRIAVLNCLIL